MKRLVFDLDDTLCTTTAGDYKHAKPNAMVIEKIRQYKHNGFEIVISTSRNVRTYEGSIGKINANTLPVIIEWLREQEVPYDEIYVGKPWCGHEGFYVDDKAIRPQEFLDLSYAQICDLVGIGK